MIANQKNTAAHEEKGFTLVEILIALTIFAVGILGVASMQVWGLRGNASAIRHSEAATLVADQIEQLMMTPYATLITTPSGTATQGDYNITWGVAPETPIPFTTTITVNVTWNDHGTVKTFRPPFTFYRAAIGP